MPRSETLRLGCTIALIALSAPAFADDGWDRVAKFISTVSCTVLLLSAFGAVFHRTIAIILAVLVGGPMSYWAYQILTGNAVESWTAFLTCYAIFLLACAFGILRRPKPAAQPSA
jgi:hypothetical protein